jgi:hypothetical protein
MKRFSPIILVVLMSSLLAAQAVSHPAASGSKNAALRYWSAFSQVQDYGITIEQAKELNAILDGTAPYDDSKYRPLLEKNTLALEVMTRGTSLPYCDWGLDYTLGDELPVEYAREGLALGRLNVLNAFHLFKAGDRDGAVRALTAGMRFSHDLSNGGSLFATLLAKDLLVSHLRAVADAVKTEHLSADEKTRLQGSVALLAAHGVDWQSAMKLEMELLNKPPSQASIPLGNVRQAYLAALADPTKLPEVERAIRTLPLPLRDVIPNPNEVVRQKQELDDRILQTKTILQP